jgi:hypothetical protein
MASTSQEQEAVVVPVNVDVRNSEYIFDFLINKCRFCKLCYEHKFYIFFFLLMPSRFLPYGFYGTFSVGRFSLSIPFLPILSFRQVVRRGSGALSPATHAHSTSHSQTYPTLIHPWAPFPDGTRTRADLAVVVERVSLFLPPPYRQPLIDIHTHPWPGGGSFLRKNPPPSVGFEPTSAGTATSEHCLRQPCGHRATISFTLNNNN